MATISVLMSVYASEKPENLRRSLQSIWEDQQRKPDEIVIVEDGPLSKELHSTIQTFRGKVGNRLKLLRNEVNLGLPKSLNKGVEACTGDYIARMDSDDISMPCRFRLQEEYMERHPEVGVLGGSIREFNENCEDLGTRTYPVDENVVRHYICKANPLAHSTVMIRRNMVFGSGLRYDETHRTSQDLALWYDCLARGIRITNLTELTLRFRRDTTTLARRGRQSSRNDEFAIYVSGIRKLYGPCSWRNVYPLVRYMFRMMPTSMVKSLYSAEFRQKLLHGHRK